VHPHSARAFYDELAADYHYLYEDWNAAVARQGHALDALLRSELGDRAWTVWDCACGIGTQTIGLAARGHDVVGTDISPNAATRAAAEAAARSLRVPIAAADMRTLSVMPEAFDAVLCADNSLAHLLTEQDVHAALTAMHQALREDGLLVISTRPYEQLRAERPTATLPRITHTDRGRVISFQLWDWHPDGERYDLEHIQLHHTAAVDHDGSSNWQVHSRHATSWAITSAELSVLVSAAAFRQVTWHAETDTRYFQPVLTARKA
jgi:glycine/sarcosine N-methyltransferase